MIDQDVEKALHWFLSFIEPDKWQLRKEQIESNLDSVLSSRQGVEKMPALESVSIYDDRIGWYLYLAETFLYDHHKYEPIQGARIIPVFKRLGENIELLKFISGVEEKAERLLNADRSAPDPIIFEMLIALLWARNNWKVEFIPVSPPHKRPDIIASSGNIEWYIECKRLLPNTGYSLKERKKWLVMWRHFSVLLKNLRLPYVFDIQFHVELETLPDDFLYNELAGKLKLIVPPCTLISNEIYDVSVNPINFTSIDNHLKQYYVKYPSDQLYELIAGRRDPNRGFTCLTLCNTVRIGKGGGNNLYIDHIDFAAGAFWGCDAKRAIENKARDIRSHLAKAVRQLPKDEKSVVHVGLETLDGALVEEERFSRIANTVYKFNAKGKDLRRIYCHLFQPYSPPDQAWVFDETVYYFSNQSELSDEPLPNRFAVVPNEGDSTRGVHWMKKAP